MQQSLRRLVCFTFACCLVSNFASSDVFGQLNEKTIRVFIFAGQSNMVGADSKADDIKNFPPFAGLEDAQDEIKFSYCIGRETKTKSEGWVSLRPIKNMVGSELSFARKISRHTTEPIAIIKVAAGGTHLGGDWNPDEPSGFKLYPLALQHVKDCLAGLEKDGFEYEVEGFMWHQGENDMFNETYMKNYGSNLENFVARWREDLECPKLKFFVGELCTKTIWGMDLRPRMYAISIGQRKVAESDPLVEYVPTSHVGVEIGGGVGLHYHYGTLGQLEHGENYADAWMRSSGIEFEERQPELTAWPYKKPNKVKLFVLAGHRNMEGERAFVQDLEQLKTDESKLLLTPNQQVAFKYSIGGGHKSSNGWMPLCPSGFYDTFGPELSFGATLNDAAKDDNVAILKYTHSGSQVVDWSPGGSMAKSRNLYPSFIEFLRQSVKEIESHGNEVELAGIFYHVGENDMSYGPFRKATSEHVAAMIKQSRIDLGQPNLKWFVSQQRPTDDKSVNKIEVVSKFSALAANDANIIHIKTFDLPGQEKKLVISTAGIVQLGKKLATAYLIQN
ncbi:MAG: sialate O-acetylesterase [Mariniblastus sp.]